MSYFRLRFAKIRFQLGLRPRPAGGWGVGWGSLQRSPDSLASGEEASRPSQEPHPCLGLRPRFSALRASDFGAFGASLSPQVPLFPPNTGAARIHTVLKLSLSASITGPWLTYSVCLAAHCVLPNLSAVFMLGPTRVRDDIYAQVAKHCSAQTTPVM